MLDLSIEASLDVEDDSGSGLTLVAAEVADAMGVGVAPNTDHVGDRGQS